MVMNDQDHQGEECLKKCFKVWWIVARAFGGAVFEPPKELKGLEGH